MKRIVILFVVFAWSIIAASAADIDPIMTFKDEIDAYDKPLYVRDITYDDISGWWKIADKFALY